MNILDEMKENLIQGKEDEVVSLTKKALDEGINPGEILYKGLIPGMEVIGKKFQANEIYVPEMLIDEGSSFLVTDENMGLVKAAFPNEVNRFLYEKVGYVFFFTL